METSTIETFWTKSKLLIKGFIIVVIVLVLQIPAFFVRDIIQERQQRQEEAVAEVSSKWAGAQTVSGPVLVLPYWKYSADTTKSVGSKHFAYFLPDNLSVNATVTPREKHRGIYKVMLYSSAIHLSGDFSVPDLERLNISPGDIIWNEASLKLPVTDNKGLNEEIVLRLNDSSYVLAPQTSNDPSLQNALQAELKWRGPENLKSFSFSSDFILNGSEQILVTPSGKSTTVEMRSPWKHPSFVGDALPQQSDIKDNGFTATWKSAAHRRNFPQQWVDDAFKVSSIAAKRFTDVNYDHGVPATAIVAGDGKEINQSAFGLNLFVPVNAYQKTMRSVKYAALMILLTFAAFFLIETNNRQSVHPFQYGLIGVALILFYTLLLSFSEYIGFNASYAIASICTIGLIGWFVSMVLPASRAATVLSGVLLLLYLYIFTILQLQDYSLLIGSVGLFISLAVVMYFSRKIKW